MTTYLIGRVDRIVRRALEDLIADQDVSVVGYTAMSVLEAAPVCPTPSWPAARSSRHRG